MPQDFFADGEDDQGVVFTKEEDQFLEGKLAFLDPRKTYQIPMGSVLSLLKFSGLEKQAIKKIISNSCQEGSKTISYDEMKKIFRGIALKQKGIEPSKINIEANIKTKMPIFHDDDESDEEPQQKPQQPASMQKPPQSQTNNRTPTPASNTQPTRQPAQQPTSNDPLAPFHEMWKNLKTSHSHQLIDGSEVKKLCSNNNTDKHKLSKAWKLCNISEKGSLTKGEFFVFINLVNSQNDIPASLTPEMKQMIQKIENQCGYVSKKTQKTSSSTPQVPANHQTKKEFGGGFFPSQPQVSQSKPPTAVSSSSTMAKSDLFDKFGGPESGVFDKPSSSKQHNFQKQTSIMKNTSVASSQTAKFPQPQPQQQSANSGAITTHVEKLTAQGKQLQQQSVTHHQQITVLHQNNQQLTQGLSALEQYLQITSQNHQQTTKQIQSLKGSQKQLTDRLNNVCIQLKTLLTKQTECISEMTENMNQQNDINLKRLNVLEEYTQEMTKIVDKGVADGKVTIQKVQVQQSQKFSEVKQSQNSFQERLLNQERGFIQEVSQKANISSSNTHHQQEEQKVYGQNNNHNHNHGSADDNDDMNKQDPFADDTSPPSEPRNNQPHHHHHHQPPQAISPPQHEPQPQQSSSPQHHPQQQRSSLEQKQASQLQQPSSPQQQIDIDNLTPQQKIKIKQMQLIQMVNYITPIKQEEYAGVVQRITSMSEEQMNMLYAKLYDMYQKKEQEKQEKEREEADAFPNADEFNTSQFIDEKTIQKVGGPGSTSGAMF